MHIDHPFHIGSSRRTATTSEAAHLRDLIEQVLFTNPGERVNRPEFGSGLSQLVFAGNGDELATAAQFLVQGALQQHLGDRLQIEAVGVHTEESTLTVTVTYRVRTTGERITDPFSRPL